MAATKMFADDLSPKDIPEDAYPTGAFELGDVIFNKIHGHWREGKQIVLFVGSGISAQSGFPTLSPLGTQLLTLESLHNAKLQLPVKNDTLTSRAYSLERDGWVSPSLFPEFYSTLPVDAVRRLLIGKIEKVDSLSMTFKKNVTEEITASNIDNISGLAKSLLGLNWFDVLNSMAGSDPQYFDTLFDAIGKNVQPGPAHNLLAQFASWFNVKLILTTNFDSLIERSMNAEYQEPYVYDVQIQSPPPSPEIINQHLSIVKLHGTHFGIRADDSINTPMDEGHLLRFIEYFDNDALILVLGYGGQDRRVIDLFKRFLEKKTKGHIIRIDDLNIASWIPSFDGLYDAKFEKRFSSLYYPYSRFFLLDAYQKCTGKLPNTRTHYPSIPHVPAPFRLVNKLGYATNGSAITKSSGPKPPLRLEDRGFKGLWLVISKIQKSINVIKKNTPRYAIVTSSVGEGGVSQVLSQISELSFKSHQLLWCDLNEAASVGTLMTWIYDFILSRQPDLPQVPLPLDLPKFDTTEESWDVEGLQRVADVLWDRLKRDRYLIVLNSLARGYEDLLAEANCYAEENQALMKGEAKRMMLFVAMLLKNADDLKDANCFILVGSSSTNVPLQLKTHLDGVDKNLLPYVKRCFETPEEKDIVYKINGKSKGVLYNISDPINSLPRSITGSIDILIKNDIETVKVFNNRVQATGDGEKKDRSSVTNGHLLMFLKQCAMCNRPRSWCQILALPVVNELAGTLRKKPISTPNIDAVTRAARALIGLSIDCNFLRRQQGAFYYMDGALRTKLRDLINNADADKDMFTAVNDKMLRYYERTFNLSGDITALNYYFWHATQIFLGRDVNDGLKETPTYNQLKSIAHVLFENSSQTRGYQGVYDHAFLLLRLHLFVSEAIDRSEGIEVIKENFNDLKVKIEEVLSDLYEEGEDIQSGFPLYKHMTKNRVTTDDVSKLGRNDWHELQKLCTRSSNLYGACTAGLIAVLSNGDGFAVKDDPDFLDKLNDLKKIAIDVYQESQLGLKQIDDIIKCIEMTLIYFDNVESRNNWATLIDKSDINMVISASIRLTINIHRLSVFGGTTSEDLLKKVRDDKNKRVKTEHLISAAKEALSYIIRSNRDDTSKQLWSRIHNVRGRDVMYFTNQARYETDKLSKAYYEFGLAKSYATGAVGFDNNAAEAITSLNEMEVLIYEASLIMSDDKDDLRFAQAKARQDSAVRKSQDVLRNLAECRLALVNWREVTVLLSTCHLDIVKRLVNHYIVETTRPKPKSDLVKNSIDQFETRVNDLTEASLAIQDVGMVFHFLRPVIWNDNWREARVRFQELRFIFMTQVCMDIADQLLKSQPKDVKDADDTEKITKCMRNIVESINHFIRALRLIGGGDVAIDNPYYENGVKGIQTLDLICIDKAKANIIDEWKGHIFSCCKIMWDDRKKYFDQAVFPYKEKNQFSGLDGGFAHLNEKITDVNKIFQNGTMSDVRLTSDKCRKIIKYYPDSFKIGHF